MRGITFFFWIANFYFLYSCTQILTSQVGRYELGTLLGTQFLSLADKTKLSILDDGRFLSIQYLESFMQSQDIVLTFRQSDLAFYSHLKFMSHLDPKLIDVYSETDLSKLLNKLKKLGITYLRVPNYPLPVIYNTGIKDIISNPKLSTIEYSEGGYRIFKLNYRDVGTKYSPVSSFNLGIKKNWYIHDRNKLGEETKTQLSSRVISTEDTNLSFFSKQKVLALCPNELGYYSPHCELESMAHDSAITKLIGIEGSFKGQVSLKVLLYDKSRKLIDIQPLAHYVGKQPSRATLSGQIKRDPKVKYVRPYILVGKNSQIEIIESFVHNFYVDEPLKYNQEKASGLGWFYKSKFDKLPSWGVNIDGAFLYKNSNPLSATISFPPVKSTKFPQNISIRIQGHGSFTPAIEIACDIPNCYEKIILDPILINGDSSIQLDMHEPHLRKRYTMQGMHADHNTTLSFDNQDKSKFSFRLELIDNFEPYYIGTEFEYSDITITDFNYKF